MHEDLTAARRDRSDHFSAVCVSETRCHLGVGQPNDLALADSGVGSTVGPVNHPDRAAVGHRFCPARLARDPSLSTPTKTTSHDAAVGRAQLRRRSSN